MKNIWTIFNKDIRHLGANAIAWVVVVGLIVIPSLYAWFCIYAFWDPYNNTEHLKVAVASTDEGYESSLVSVNINIGKEVQEQLRNNRKLHWIFTDRNEAIEGVKSGEYYAALIIPKDFSRNLMSIFSEDVHPAEIVYYLNEKENVIAAKVTNQGANTIQKTIDEAFAETTSRITLSSMRTISNALNEQDSEALVEHLHLKMTEISTELDSAAATMDNLCSMNSSLNALLKSTDALLTETGENTSGAVRDLHSMNDSFPSLENDLNAMSEKIDTVFQNTDQAYTAIDDLTAQYLQNMNGNTQEIASSLNTIADQIGNTADRFREFQDSLQNLSDSLPVQMSVSRTLLNETAISLNRSIQQQDQIHDSLQEAASDMSAVSSDALQYQQDLSSWIDNCSKDMKDLRRRFQNELQPEMKSLSDALTQTGQSTGIVSDGLNGTASELKNLSESTSGQIDQINQNLTGTRDLLLDAAGKIRGILDQMSQNDGSSAQELLNRLISNDSSTVSSYFSSVVKLDTHLIYPVDNFGTAMTPFYTCLGIWVGAVVLVAMLKVDVSGKMLEMLKEVKNWQIYLGRSGVFLLLGLLQSLLVSTGDLLFLGVRCAHPILFVVTCLYISIVFVTLIYTLTVSFGNVGKAIAVILLVFQVASSGGTIPIEMTPSFFHVFYPLLPVTHSMEALRECVAGLYGYDYIQELAILSVYFWLSLLLGLVLRNPVINLNRGFIEKVESTKVM